MNDDVSKVHNNQDTGSHNGLWPVPPCLKISCDENSCLWHRCILKIPQHVIWHAEVRKITLDKRSGESFGFTPKAKQHTEGKDFYYLVKTVDQNGLAAQCGLRTGDLILSVNQIPIQSQNKLSEISFKKMNSVKLQIQRPYALSQTANKYIAQLSKSMELNVDFLEFPGIQQPRSPESPSALFWHAPSDYENIPLPPVVPRRVPRINIHKLPQVRMFVIGHAMKEFVHHMFGLDLPAESKPCCLHLSMKRFQDGFVTCGNIESFSYLMTEGSEECINIELFCVPEDSFFHLCCSWMFTPLSVFVLTFDTNRLSQCSNVELVRLKSLVQTVKANTSWENKNVYVYGLSQGSEIIRKEEIQTLFYTLPDKYLPLPVVLSTASDNYKVILQARTELYQLLSQVTKQQNVTTSTILALDLLLSFESLTITLDQLVKLLEDRDQEMSKHKLQTLQDLTDTGNLIVTGGNNCGVEYILPVKLFTSLSNLAKCMETYRTSMADQNMNWKLCITGMATRSDLMDIAAQCTDDSYKFVACMEFLRLIIPMKPCGSSPTSDSGFNDEMQNLLFPLFLEDIPFVPPDTYNKYFTLEASEDLAVPFFYDLISTLSQSQDCHTFTMFSQMTAHFDINGLEFYLNFIKPDRQLVVYRPRSDQGMNKALARLIFELLEHLQTQVKFVLTYEEQSPSQLGRVLNPSASPSVLSRKVSNEMDYRLLEVAQDKVLDMRVANIRCIGPDLQRIYRHLSIENGWEKLAGLFGLTVSDIMVYESIRSNRLPAENFLVSYFHETGCTLRTFLKALRDLASENNECQELAEHLWNSALYHNSDFFRHYANRAAH
ncbi:hypothetical protein Bpfe_029030 [Biomphalaria pfeifferi]|uniref:PDZ domain-containing protein n=1 Tax=Biomphalaria pfeifferi TaxID=112525 RepID=A0AAD8ASD0_BIOPF|nr:hypothetical protein Bpfe_029030 [Biomphalaria pfeifferi]